MVIRILKEWLYPKAKSTKKISLSRSKEDGQVHNLQEIYDRINDQYFQNRLKLPIEWFGDRFVQPRRQLTFGTYTEGTGLIRIHRLLDQGHIPEYFVAFIIYHEMLHHVHPPIKRRRRRLVHHEKFKAKEKEFHAYEEAKEFRERLKKHFFYGRGRLRAAWD